MSKGGAATLAGYDAERRVAEAFRQLGYVVHQEVLLGPLEIDLVIEKDAQRTPVQVIASGRPIQSDRLRQEIVRLSTLRGADIWTGVPIIVTATDMTLATRHWASHQKDVIVRSLMELEAEAGGGEPTAHVEASGPPPTAFETEPSDSRRHARDGLIQELRDHYDGVMPLSATDFELLCLRTFTFLFDPDLFGFERQGRTADGGNRYDFICRIATGQSSFWDGLRNDFRTRALLFECKNYEDRITADQIYSTERYLFAGALRTVCFLIARRGGDDGCMRAAQGAMRESGKLILVLSNLDLVEMLEFGEDKKSAENLLDERIWRFIISLPR